MKKPSVYFTIREFSDLQGIWVWGKWMTEFQYSSGLVVTIPPFVCGVLLWNICMKYLKITIDLNSFWSKEKAADWWTRQDRKAVVVQVELDLEDVEFNIECERKHLSNWTLANAPCEQIPCDHQSDRLHAETKLQLVQLQPF